MTKRELILYMLAGCGLWLLTYWRRILLAVGVVVVILFLTSCVVGTLPTPQPTPAPSATPWPTNTPDPTPTRETDCSPHYWALLWAYTNVYADPDLTIRLIEDGAEVVLKPGRAVLLLESQDYAYRVVTADGDKVEGWVPFYVLPVECR